MATAKKSKSKPKTKLKDLRAKKSPKGGGGGITKLGSRLLN